MFAVFLYLAFPFSIEHLPAIFRCKDWFSICKKRPLLVEGPSTCQKITHSAKENVGKYSEKADAIKICSLRRTLLFQVPQKVCGTVSHGGKPHRDPEHRRIQQ